ncbi:hypothetical protein EVAR_31337_1 [Eumeta japonica]|uniref:Uncharacterized protein n=1 Tax=Eumeta variegata TaxID=151549 RepID=A0A4C1Y1C4_EUMVA|nr:hypothetical protein EVAR_31337_1 [Eumeta japonica]
MYQVEPCEATFPFIKLSGKLIYLTKQTLAAPAAPAPPAPRAGQSQTITLLLEEADKSLKVPTERKNKAAAPAGGPLLSDAGQELQTTPIPPPALIKLGTTFAAEM